MNHFLRCNVLLLITLMTMSAVAENEFKPIFDGKTLTGWDGDDKFWSVKDGAITGQTTKENPTKGNTFIVWRGGQVDDFELKLKYKIINGNSGIQYRAYQAKGHGPHVIAGYQADFEAGDTYSGILYSEKERGILAQRGQKTTIGENGKPKVTGNIADTKDLQKKINKEDWNDYHIIAKGNKLIHKINGQTMIEVTDEDTSHRRRVGLLALQLHAGPPMTVQFKDIQLKRTKLEDAKKVLFIAGPRSHGWGSHEHYAGSKLLSDALNDSGEPVVSYVVKNGFPRYDPTYADNVDAIVMYCDGGGRHMVLRHLEEVDKLAKKGVGIACFHYGVEVPKGEPGELFLEWIGGYFETHWSVNPHWTAEFKSMPGHEINKGVKPFDIRDEWYYHMRFRENMKGVAPILTAVPPKSTLNRKDGPHSGNPHVRAKAGQPQHVAWAFERPGGGRGFGFTGGHFHNNWKEDNFRKVALNAILWTAGGKVPDGGIKSKTPTDEQMDANQDYPKPGAKKKETEQIKANLKNAKPIAKTPVITNKTEAHSAKIKADIKGAKKLFLVITDGGNGYSCDWANWVEPKLTGPKGEKKLTDLKWKSASSDWGKVNINKNANGQNMIVNGKPVAYGIGAHAVSIIEYDLPDGYTHFEAIGALDHGGVSQQNGSQTSVSFEVYTTLPKSVRAKVKKQPQNVKVDDKIVPTDLFNLPDDLEITVWAESPLLRNPTNMDIDHAGRIWVAEGMNYRGSRKRPEGDQIVVLTDTNGDGKADKSHTFVQDKELVSPLGIAVIGNKIVVSQPPHLIVYTDVNNDLKFDPKVDKRENLLSGFQGNNHDHSLHSVTVGPDGLWYFNCGNTGATVTDRSNRTFRIGSFYSNKDVSGQKSDDGHVYVGGTAFRMNPDGTQLQPIGHNFRNSYEQTITSFGDVFQNDNDDPPNCRTSWLMEYGNAGFASADGKRNWGSDRRPGQSSAVAHWHQDDPGTMPPGDVYGGGAPTGIVFYENGALPKKYRGLLISCESSRNTLFGYQPKLKGSHFTMERFDFLTTNEDKVFVGTDFSNAGTSGELYSYFRPSDVSVGPDGAIYIADWFDSRVGGHSTRDGGATGAIYRIAPKNAKLSIPEFDLTTIPGQITALKSPAHNVRALGFNALVKSGPKALPHVTALLDHENPYIAARAIFVLANLGESGVAKVESLLNSSDTQTKIAAYRALRRTQKNFLPYAHQLIKDSHPAIQREVALSLRDVSFEDSARLLTVIAANYDGKDRYYLEAFGTGATNKEQQLYQLLQPRMGSDINNWSQAFANIAWRLHPPIAIPHLQARAINPDLSEDQRKLATDALAFIKTPAAANAMVEIASTDIPKTRDIAIWWVRHRHNNDWRPYNVIAKIPPKPTKKPVIVIPPNANPQGNLPPIAEIAKLKGNPNKGEQLFYAKATCFACHTVKGKGGAIGPDLSAIAKNFDNRALIESMVDPASSIALGFETVIVTRKDGSQVSGFISQEGDPLVIKDVAGNQIGIDRKDIKSSQKVKTSLMPPVGLLGLKAQEVADLAAYLRSLK